LWLDLGEYRGPSRFHAFVGYALARRRERSKLAAYRVYVTESLRLIPQSKYIPHELEYYLTPHEDIDAEAIIDKVFSAVTGEHNEPA
jgi:hypothetical protein